MAALSENRRARFDYNLLDTYEAGIALLGHEVKAVKAGKANIAGSFVRPEGGELWLMGADIPPYQPANTPKEYDPHRARRLLLNKKEIGELMGRVTGERLTIVPIKMYTKRGLVKLEIALASSKKKADKREAIKKRDTTRELSRVMRRR